MKKIRVGVIGQGRSGRAIHVVELVKERLKDKYEIGAVADLQPERCNETQLETGCDVYQDYKEMLKDKSLELIINASQSPDHGRINIEAMESGHNVLSEKPLARSVASVDKQIEVSKKTGMMLAVFQQSRFSPTYRKLREIIESGVLGRTVMIKVAFNGYARRWDWQTLQDMDAGNLLNTGPHPLDQALQLFGDVDPEKITCIMDRANTFGDAEDHVKLIMQAAGKPTIDLEISSCSMYNPYVYQVCGTRGGLTGTHEKLEWKYFLPEEAPLQKLIREPMPNRAYCSENMTWYTADWTASQRGMEFGFRTMRYYENLYDVMRNGKQNEVTLEQVRRQIKVIEECHRQNPLSKLPAE